MCLDDYDFPLSGARGGDVQCRTFRRRGDTDEELSGFDELLELLG